MIPPEEYPHRGRPPGATGDAKQARVTVRCDLAEKGVWVKKARDANLKLSEWLRQLANQAAGGE